MGSSNGIDQGNNSTQITFANEQKRGSPGLLRRLGNAVSKNERVILEMKILRYRKLARQIATDPDTARRIKELIDELERELRAIDE